MVLDPLTAIGLVGNIVQFVDFSSRIVSKTRQLYQSADGALTENVDTETVTKDLIELNTKLQARGSHTSGISPLEKLSTACNNVGNELITALGKVKVDGKKGRWKSTRKALRSVWSQEKIEGIEKRLAGFRDEMNLRIVVDLRGRLDQLSTQHAQEFGALSSRNKTILDALINNRDVFQQSVQAQTDKVRKMLDQTDAVIGEEHAKTRTEIVQTVYVADAHNREEHAEMRIVVVENVTAADASNREQHEATRQQVKQLEHALTVLKGEIRKRDEELKEFLSAFTQTHSPAKRRKLQERSNAVSAALLALETVYRRLEALLATIRSQAKPMLANLNVRHLWGLTPYPSPSVQLIAPAEDALMLYYAYYYFPLITHNQFVSRRMHLMWPIDPLHREEPDDLIDESLLSALVLAESHKNDKPPKAYECIWFVVSIAAVLKECYESETDQFSVLEAAFNRRSAIFFGNSEYTNRSALLARLRQDFKVWKTIARVTGLQNGISAWIADSPFRTKYPLKHLVFGSHEAGEMASFMNWLMGGGIHGLPACLQAVSCARTSQSHLGQIR